MIALLEKVWPILKILQTRLQLKLHNKFLDFIKKMERFIVFSGINYYEFHENYLKKRSL